MEKIVEYRKETGASVVLTTEIVEKLNEERLHREMISNRHIPILSGINGRRSEELS